MELIEMKTQNDFEDNNGYIDTMIIQADKIPLKVMNSVLEDWLEQGYENQVKRMNGHVWLIARR